MFTIRAVPLDYGRPNASTFQMKRLITLSGLSYLCRRALRLLASKLHCRIDVLASPEDFYVT